MSELFGEESLHCVLGTPSTSEATDELASTAETGSSLDEDEPCVTIESDEESEYDDEEESAPGAANISDDEKAINEVLEQDLVDLENEKAIQSATNAIVELVCHELNSLQHNYAELERQNRILSAAIPAEQRAALLSGKTDLENLVINYPAVAETVARSINAQVERLSNVAETVAHVTDKTDRKMLQLTMKHATDMNRILKVVESTTDTIAKLREEVESLKSQISSTERVVTRLDDENTMQAVKHMFPYVFYDYHKSSNKYNYW